MYSILLKNAKICGKYEDIVTDILIDNGKIKQISDDCFLSFDTKVIDLKGKYVLPGLIDLNCNVSEPGYDDKEDLRTVSKSAAKSGFTSLTANPNTDPSIDNKIIVGHLNAMAKEKALVNIFPYGHMTKGGLNLELSEMGEMQRAGIVAVSDGNKSVSDSFILKNIFSYANMFDLPIITYCDNPLLTNDGSVNLGYASALTGLRGIPVSAEEVYVARNLILAKEEKCKIHITKITTSASVELIRFAKKMGIDVTCDTCPPYMFLDEEKVINYDTRYKISPPLRTKSDNEALIEGLIDGTIDAISTGHLPEHSKTKKREFESASFGFSGLEPAFIVCYNNLVLNGKLSLYELVSKMSKNAYDIIKIKNKGQICELLDADIFVFDPEGSTYINEKELESKAKYSVYHEQTFKGSVDLTIVGGRIIFDK